MLQQFNLSSETAFGQLDSTSAVFPTVHVCNATFLPQYFTAMPLRLEMGAGAVSQTVGQQAMAAMSSQSSKKARVAALPVIQSNDPVSPLKATQVSNNRLDQLMCHCEVLLQSTLTPATHTLTRLGFQASFRTSSTSSANGWMAARS